MLLVATKLVHNAKLPSSNYWSPLACLVKEQEEHVQENPTKIENGMFAIAAVPEEDKQDLSATREISRKTFMFPDGCTIRRCLMVLRRAPGILIKKRFANANLVE